MQYIAVKVKMFAYTVVEDHEAFKASLQVACRWRKLSVSNHCRRALSALSAEPLGELKGCPGLRGDPLGELKGCTGLRGDALGELTGGRQGNGAGLRLKRADQWTPTSRPAVQSYNWTIVQSEAQESVVELEVVEAPLAAAGAESAAALLHALVQPLVHLDPGTQQLVGSATGKLLEMALPSEQAPQHILLRLPRAGSSGLALLSIFVVSLANAHYPILW
ncbi:MAG: hypothetical protein FRX49_05419 [Trebouxia sp. A1-2]|nr:MAG: hypothetical protein FRX49_05419 [Trebouxia sp. A1-2]